MFYYDRDKNYTKSSRETKFYDIRYLIRKLSGLLPLFQGQKSLINKLCFNLFLIIKACKIEKKKFITHNEP